MEKKGLSEKIRLGALVDFAKEKQAKNYHLRVTSGTSGNEPLLFAKHRRLEIVKGSKRICSNLQSPVFCWGQINVRMSLLGHFLFFYPDKDRRVLNLTEAELVSDDLEKLIGEFEPDSFCGLPSFIAQVLLKINDRKVLENIKYLSFAGERVSPAQRAIFREKVPSAKIRCFYASVEAGYISEYPCGFLKINTFHPAENVRVEIKNPDKEEIGEITISLNLSKSTRLENYATGDTGRILPEKCPCGKPMIFEILGRKNFDFIKFLGATLRQEVFEKALAEHGFIKDFRVLAREIPSRDKIFGEITVRVILQNSVHEADHYKNILLRDLPRTIFLTPTRTLDQLIEAKLFLPLKIEIVSKFPFQIKEVKMKKVE